MQAGRPLDPEWVQGTAGEICILNTLLSSSASICISSSHVTRCSAAQIDRRGLRARRNRNKRLISESSTTIPAVTALISVVDHVPSVPVLLAEADGVQGPCERGIAESRKLGRTFVSLSHSFRVDYCVTFRGVEGGGGDKPSTSLCENKRAQTGATPDFQEQQAQYGSQ